MMVASELPLRRMRPLLGTFVEIGAAGGAPQGAQAINAAFAEVAHIQRLLAFQDPDSELSRLNRSNGAHIALSGLTRRVLWLARGMTRASGHLFNCTVGGALVQSGHLPDHGGPACLPVGTAEDLQLSPDGARLARPVRITLDGIAKGFAVDRALTVLRQHGVRDAWVNAGGDARAMGELLLPVQIRGCGTRVGLRNAALATSATQARYDAALPGEILSPSGLQPASGQWSVLAARAWRADALTKVAALAPVQHRAQLLARLGGRLIESAQASRSTRAAQEFRAA